MDSSLDWRPLLARLRAAWRTIGLTALVAVITAGAVSLRNPNRYRAEAILAVAKPGAVFEFDPRLRGPDLDPSFPYRVSTLRTYPELAKTAALAAAVRVRLGDTPLESASVDDLLRRVDVRAMAEGGLIAIEARATTPEAAAQIANAWAEVFSEHMESIFGATADVALASAARDQAAEDLATAEDTLAAFDELSPLPALEVELAQLESHYGALLASGDRLAAAARDMRLLGGQPSGNRGRAIAARLATLAFELNALSVTTDTLRVALELPSGTPDSPPSAAELDAVEMAVRAAREAVQVAADELPGDIAALNGALRREQLEREALERNRMLVEERYLTLARRADELTTAGATTRPEVRIAIPAVPPERPDYGGLVVRVLAALVLGLVVGALVALVLPSRLQPPPGSGSGRAPEAKAPSQNTAGQGATGTRP